MGLWQTIVSYFSGKSLDEPAVVDPNVRLQQIINEQAAKLVEGQNASRFSGDLVRRLQQERDCLMTDVQTLERRPDTNADRLNRKRAEFANKQSELDAAAEQHKANLKVISEYTDIINQARADANRLKVDLDMAKVTQEAVRFQSSLSNGVDNDSAADARDEIQQQIRKARAMAEVDRSLMPDKKSDEQYLNAAEGK